MTTVVQLDRYKLMHWLNARKLTPDHIHTMTGIELDTTSAMALPEDGVQRLASALEVAPDALLATASEAPSLIHRSAADLHATKRAVRRDGIHFYNYYSMPAPSGYVGPVVLDILCPADRLPRLNNGHLEPAITVNIGPGDINGRWGEEITGLTWRPLHAQADWIVGDSYLEPSYRPHSYSLRGDEPARIISYTCKSNLHSLLTAANDWPDDAYDRLVAAWSGGAQASMLGVALSRRAHDAATLAAASGLPEQRIARCLGGDATALDVADLRRCGEVLGVDHRLLLAPEHRHDEIGKTWCSLQDSAATVRNFASYTVASMVAAPQLPDITGLYLKVSTDGSPPLDLTEHGPTHYFVTGGSPTVGWIGGDGVEHRQRLAPDDSLWVGPCVAHGFGGDGALIKLGNGEGYGYLEHLELAHTVERAATLRRARRDAAGWGYEPTTP